MVMDPACSSGIQQASFKTFLQFWSGGEWLGRLGSNQHLPG